MDAPLNLTRCGAGVVFRLRFITRAWAWSASLIVRLWPKQERVARRRRWWFSRYLDLSEYADVELNTKGRYAVMAMADIAKHALAHAHSQNGAEAIPLSLIAERQHISLAYLEQLFLRLRRAGLVESARGRAGGYRLGRPANAITVADVMIASRKIIA